MGTRRCLGRLLKGSRRLKEASTPGLPQTTARTLGIGGKGPGVGSAGRSACSLRVSGDPAESGVSLGRRKVAELASERKTRREQL